MRKNKSRILAAFIGIMFVVCLGYNKGKVVFDGPITIDPVPIPYSSPANNPEPDLPIIPEPETPIIPEPDSL